MYEKLAFLCNMPGKEGPYVRGKCLFAGFGVFFPIVGH